MKNTSKELNVDFIGGQGPLTKKEEEEISKYLRNQKILKTKKQGSCIEESYKKIIDKRIL